MKAQGFRIVIRPRPEWSGLSDNEVRRELEAQMHCCLEAAGIESGGFHSKDFSDGDDMVTDYDHSADRHDVDAVILDFYTSREEYLDGTATRRKLVRGVPRYDVGRLLDNFLDDYPDRGEYVVEVRPLRDRPSPRAVIVNVPATEPGPIPTTMIGGVLRDAGVTVLDYTGAAIVRGPGVSPGWREPLEVHVPVDQAGAAVEALRNAGFDPYANLVVRR